jgi:hypothetical protein
MSSILQMRAQYESLATQYRNNLAEISACNARRDEGMSLPLLFYWHLLQALILNRTRDVGLSYDFLLCLFAEQAVLLIAHHCLFRLLLNTLVSSQ